MVWEALAADVFNEMEAFTSGISLKIKDS